jgi:Rho GDP-dissociation inhibitor
VPLKEQLEKDKEDESLRRWKEQLLGYAASLDTIGDGFHSDHPEVKVSRLGISAKGREELGLPLPLTTTTDTPQAHAFSLKVTSHYQLKFIFTVRNNILSGLTCINGKLASWSKRCAPCLGPLLGNRSLMFTF